LHCQAMAMTAFQNELFFVGFGFDGYSLYRSDGVAITEIVALPEIVVTAPGPAPSDFCISGDTTQLGGILYILSMHAGQIRRAGRSANLRPRLHGE
jgi:hypothetical protein